MGCGTSMSESQILKQSCSPKKNHVPQLEGDEVKSTEELQNLHTQKVKKISQSKLQTKIQSQQKLQQNRIQTAQTTVNQKQKQKPIQKVQDFQCQQLIEQQKIFQLNKSFLFGQSSENQTRKIIQFDAEKMQFTLIASRTKKTQNTHKYQPQEIIFQESQQLQASALYNKYSHPPYNFMFATFFQQDKIFLCGGVNASFQYISDQAFIYKIKKNQKTILTQNNLSSKQKGNNLLGLKFQRVPYMHKKRFSHMGVYLTMGKLNYIFVFGGRSEDDQILKHCQRYCFQQKKWTEIPEMKVPRSTGFSFIFRSKIYICGGYSGQKKRSKQVQVYDPIKNYWEEIDFKLHRGIQAGIIFSTKPNEILIMGGNMELGSLKSVIKYNLADKTYIWDSNMKNQRFLQKGMKYNDQIFIFGGDFQQTFQKYSLKDRKWRDQKVKFSQLVSPDDINSYSFANQTIKVHFDQTLMTVNIQKQQSVNEFQKFYIFGNDNFPCILQINLSKWVLKKKAVPITLRLRSYMGIAKIKQGKYFICGGIDDYGQKCSRVAYLYYGGTNKAIQIQKMKQKKYEFGICHHEEYVYIFGGKNQKDILSQSQRYNLKEEKWQQLPNLSRERTKGKTLCLQDSILLFGGQDSLQSISEIQIFSIKTKQFTVYKKTIPISSLIRGIFCLQNQKQFLIFSHNDLLGDDYCHRFSLDKNLIQTSFKTQQNQLQNQSVNKRIKTQEEDIFASQLDFKEVNLKVLPFYSSFLFNQNFYFLTSKGLVNWKYVQSTEERDTMKPQIVINQVQLLQYPIQKFSFS